jgi:signal transduction histidine kinase/ActR/RegA family two-component response regulator
MKGAGLRLRVFLATMTVIVAFLALTYGAMRSLVDRILEAEIQDGLARARRAQASFSEMRSVVLLEQARSVAQVPHLRAVLDTPGVDRSTVVYTIASLEKALDAELLFVSDAHGAILADTQGTPERREPYPAVAGGLAGHESCGIWEYAGEPYLVAVSPVVLDGAVLGAVGLGYPLEQHALDLRRVTGLDVTLVDGERLLAAAWSGDAAPPRADPAPWTQLEAEIETRLDLGDREYMAVAVPLAGSQLELVLSRPLDDVLEHIQRARRELLVIGSLIAVVGLVVSHWVSERIARPIRALTGAARALARGELDTAVDVRARDEVGLLAQAFNHMTRQISALMKEAVEKTRAAEQASEAKSVFLATMSHEMRTPLNGVLGFAEQLQVSQLSAEQREQLGFIQRSGQDLLGIIDEVLDFARLEAGEMRLEQSEFRLSSCLGRALDPLRPAIAAKGLELSLEIEEGVPETLIGPASRLRQIAANYANNALKFTASGAIRVRAGRLSETPESVLLRISVEDTGIGIPADRIGQLFRPFAQLDSGANREYRGTGLGLAICKELAALMQGQVGVHSTPGVGSTFWFTALLKKHRAESALPGREPAATTPQQPPSWLPDAAARERRGRQRILVAEDNPVNQRVVAAVLQRAGWSHVLVENGSQAVERFAAQAFDLVLMDCQMPVLDGLEATRRIRALEPGARVPIVALTANAFGADRAACLAAGMDDFLAKPFKTPELIATLDRWLAARSAA